MYGDADKGRDVEFAAEVEIFQVDGHEASVGGADDAVEEELASDEVGSLGGFVEGVVDAIASDCPADSSWVVFFRTISTDDADVCGLDIAWEVFAGDEDASVGAGGDRGIGSQALEHAADLLIVGSSPMLAIARLC